MLIAVPNDHSRRRGQNVCQRKGQDFITEGWQCKTFRKTLKWHQCWILLVLTYYIWLILFQFDSCYQIDQKIYSCLIFCLHDRAITDSRPQSLLCASVYAFTSTLHHSSTEPRLLWLQENSGKVKNNTWLTFRALIQSFNLSHRGTSWSNCFFLPAVVAVVGGNAVRSHWSLPLQRHGPGRSSGEAVRRSCWRVKAPMSPEETGSEREPSLEDRVSPRRKQSRSAAESGSLVRKTVLHNTGHTGKWYSESEFNCIIYKTII